MGISPHRHDDKIENAMSEEIQQIIFVSLKVSLVSTVIVMTSSLLLAPLLVFSSSRMLKILEIFIYVPLAMPPVALGYALLLVFGPQGVLGKLFISWGMPLAFSFNGAVLAACLVSLGIGVRTLKAACLSIDWEQCEVARLLGANISQIYRHIIFPQCHEAFLGGAILVFIRALSEFGATMIFAGNSLGSTRTLALAIWIDMETPGKENNAALLVMIAIFISSTAVIISEILLRFRRH
jgi:molybdate transport system permease protein